MFSFRMIKAALKRRVIATVVSFLAMIWVVVSLLEFYFEHGATGANIVSLGDAFWWGIVTFLTVGYGDRYPVTTEGRFFAGVLMVSGVIVTGIITAKISAYFLEQALKEGRGIVDTDRLKNHFVVCGWKEDVDRILLSILKFNPEIHADDLVLIANIDQSKIDNLKAIHELHKMKVVHGEPHLEQTLRRAAPERSIKIMILADHTPKADGSIPSDTEIDARTVMTAMTLHSIAKGVLVTAEILDPKMDSYLKLAHVNEIIYSQEYSRLLLSNAAGGTGVANIVFDLLNPETSSMITTQSFAESYVGRTYGELKKDIEGKNPDISVIGILRNCGNQYRIKEQALRKAQKTPDMAKLVNNLHAIKELRYNDPLFNPRTDSILPEGAMVIVVINRISNAQEVGHDSSQAPAA